MATDTATRDFELTPPDNARLANLCGPLDEHLQQVERTLKVDIRHRGARFHITGRPESTLHAEQLLKDLFATTERQEVTPERVHLSLRELDMDEGIVLTPNSSARAPGGALPPASMQSSPATGRGEPGLNVRTQRGGIHARGPNQKQYLDNIRTHDLTFGIGPAGTGKTYLAVACAVESLQADRVRRIVLVRPAVEAGERLGFLPGDMAQKIDPYLRPMYDALYEMLGFERTARYVERAIIEVAPLAFMRGRSLNDSFVILDEAQNTTPEQMKMFLTRIGFGSKAVVTGDVTQTDLPAGRTSGLRHVADILPGVQGVAFTHFAARDVVRHPLVQRIVQAYESKGADES